MQSSTAAIVRRTIILLDVLILQQNCTLHFVCSVSAWFFFSTLIEVPGINFYNFFIKNVG